MKKFVNLAIKKEIRIGDLVIPAAESIAVVKCKEWKIRELDGIPVMAYGADGVDGLPDKVEGTVLIVHPSVMRVVGSVRDDVYTLRWLAQVDDHIEVDSLEMHIAI